MNVCNLTLTEYNSRFSVKAEIYVGIKTHSPETRNCYRDVGLRSLDLGI